MACLVCDIEEVFYWKEINQPSGFQSLMFCYSSAVGGIPTPKHSDITINIIRNNRSTFRPGK